MGSVMNRAAESYSPAMSTSHQGLLAVDTGERCFAGFYNQSIQAGGQSAGVVWPTPEESLHKLLARGVKLKGAPIDRFAEDTPAVQHIQFGGTKRNVWRIAGSDSVIEMPHQFGGGSVTHIP